MPDPTLSDDGQTVQLDLHGATVADALVLARDVLREAARRGRREVTLIHGHSTSDPHGENRTIKHELLRTLNRGDFDHIVTGIRRHRSRLVLQLDLTATPDPNHLRLQDL